MLSGLSSNKATGLDKISCKIIKIAALVIADSLTYIFNQAITLSSFLDEWKMAIVIPLYKSGHRNIPGNYRPISILPTISKIMERILYNQLYNYLTEFGLLSGAQFGFRKSHSTATALLDCTNDWYMNIDKKMFNLVVFIDLKKAFDTVNHDILLKKLEFYGIKGQALDLLKSYLSNRHQKCQVESFVSSEHLIKCGVPQGSILGPLLFLLLQFVSSANSRGLVFLRHSGKSLMYTSTTYPSVLKIQDLGYSLMIQTSQPLVTP